MSKPSIDLRYPEFIENQELRFLYDAKDTFKKALVRREAKEKAAKLMKMIEHEEEEVSSAE